MAKFAFWRTIGAAYAFVFTRPLQFLKIVWPWIVLFFAAELGLQRLGRVLLPQSPLRYVLASSLVYLVALGALVAVSVALHRDILLGESSWRAALRFGRRQWRFLWIGIVITLAMVVPIFVVFRFVGISLQVALMSHSGIWAALIGTLIAMWVIGLALWFLVGRMMLGLPAAAVDEREPLLRAWDRASGGNAWRLFFGSLLCGLPLTMLENLVDRFLPVHVATSMTFKFQSGASLRIKELWLPGDAVSTLFTILEVSVLIAFYSYAYRALAAAPLPSTVALGDPVPR